MARFHLTLAFTVATLAAVPVAALAQSPWPSNPPAAANNGPSPFDQAPANAAPRGPSPFDQAPGNAAPRAASPFDQGAAPAPSAFDQPAAGGFGAPPQESPCVKGFIALRLDTEKTGKALQAAGQRKATPQEACGLFNTFINSEAKLIKYAEANAAACGIPKQALAQMKTGHGGAVAMRTRVCNAAKAQEQGPIGPSLGDALGASPLPGASNLKTGRGTFDTLTGTPLGSGK